MNWLSWPLPPQPRIFTKGQGNQESFFEEKIGGKIVNSSETHNSEMFAGGELEQRSVEKMDIVVGFRPEYLREATVYALT